jgi:hypothetical protein
VVAAIAELRRTPESAGNFWEYWFIK